MQLNEEKLRFYIEKNVSNFYVNFLMGKKSLSAVSCNYNIKLHCWKLTMHQITKNLQEIILYIRTFEMCLYFNNNTPGKINSNAPTQ